MKNQYESIGKPISQRRLQGISKPVVVPSSLPFKGWAKAEPFGWGSTLEIEYHDACSGIPVSMAGQYSANILLPM